MEILLRIFHMNDANCIPAADNLKIKELFEIAVAVHKYRLLPPLAIWAKAWREAALESFDWYYFEDYARLAWIGWVYGERSLFDKAFNRMAFLVKADEQGKLSAQDGEPLEKYDYLVAMDVLGKPSRSSIHIYQYLTVPTEQLKDTRIETIASLLQIIEDELPPYEDLMSCREGTETWYCCSDQIAELSDADDQEEAARFCHEACLGSLAMELENRKLLPVPDADDILETPHDIEEKIEDACRSISTLGISGITGMYENDLEVHAKCGPGPRLISQVEEVMDKMQCSIDPEQVEHMERQAKVIAGL